MGLYRKKPVTVEARQWDGSEQSQREIQAWMFGYSVHAEGWVDSDGYYISVPTLSGKVKARPDDFIVKGVAGEFYPCNPRIFARTYEEAA